MKFLQDRNKDLPPGAPQEEIDGFRYVRREAIMALAQCRYPTLADKTHPTWLLLKSAVRDDIHPEPRLDERVEAAIGVRLRSAPFTPQKVKATVSDSALQAPGDATPSLRR